MLYFVTLLNDLGTSSFNDAIASTDRLEIGGLGGQPPISMAVTIFFRGRNTDVAIACFCGCEGCVENPGKQRG